MQPGISTLVTEGFKTAKRSWPGIGVVLLGTLLWTGAWSGLFSATGFPQEAIQPGRTPAPELFPNPAPVEPQAEAPAEDPVVATEAPAELTEEQTQQFLDWLRRAWLPMAGLLLVGFCGSVWLTGGQLGYLDAQLQGRASLAQFVASGTAKFLALAQTMLLVVALGGLGLLLVAVLVAVGQLIGGPGPVSVFLMSVVQIAGGLAALWLGVRLVLWPIAVAVGNLSPLAAMQASWRAVRGRWWRTAGVLAAWIAVSVAVGLLLALVLGIAQRLAGAGAVAAARTVLQTVVNVFIGFALNASLIALFQRVHSTERDPAGGTPSAPGAGASA